MNYEETRVDLRVPDPGRAEENRRLAELIFRLNHTMPGTEAYQQALDDLFGENLGEGSCVAAPIQGTCLNRIKIGRNVVINANLLAMARGGITIEDDVQIAANVQLLTNNHDPYERLVLTCRPILIGRNAWIGAGATILPGIRVGAHAIVGAASVVTKDVPDYAVVVGNPAKVVKTLDPAGFRDGEKSGD